MNYSFRESYMSVIITLTMVQLDFSSQIRDRTALVA